MNTMYNTLKLILHQVSPTTRQGDGRRKKQRRFFHSVSEINDVAQPVDQLVAALYCTSADLLDGRSKGGRRWWWCAAGSCPGQGVISLSLRHVAAAHCCGYGLELQTFRLVQDLQTGTQIKTAVYDSSHR